MERRPHLQFHSTVYSQEHRKLHTKSLKLTSFFFNFVVFRTQGLNFEVKADESIFTCTKSKIFKYNYNLDYHIDKIKSNSALKLESQPDHFVAYSKLFNKELVSVETKGVKNKETYVADSTISFYGVKPTVTHAEVSANVVKYSVASKGRKYYQCCQFKS